MAKKKKKLIEMKCEGCGRTNYFGRRFKEPGRKVELKKFCKFCRSHKVHKE